MTSMRMMSKIEALLSTWLTKMKPMMLTMLRTSDELKLVVAIDDVDVDPSCPKHFTGTIVVDDCSTSGNDVVVYLIYVVLPVVAAIFVASRLSNSNLVVEIDSDELDEHSRDRLLVDELTVVDVDLWRLTCSHHTYNDVNKHCCEAPGHDDQDSDYCCWWVLSPGWT